MSTAIRRAWGLAICLWLGSLGSWAAQANPRGNPLAHPSPSPLKFAAQPTPPLARAQASTPKNQPAASEVELSPFPDFPLLKKLEPLPPTSTQLDIDWAQLPLLPDPQLAEEMDREFSRRLARLNQQIASQQDRLYRLLQTWDSDEEEIRQVQAQLSQLRLERDRLALEHLLLLRQLQENFALPLPSRSAATSP
ncbi:hypothetical protein [Synechococcus sp. H70.2]|uniref:hypothetical protein n=1 Tax=Synechococcus sp. H70.2 TaxID=2964528 RepID=UPI0039C22796